MLPVACRILLLTIVAGSASPSQACRVFLPPAERIAFGYERGAISAVALVRITKATYLSQPRGDAHPWRAWARVDQVVSGSYAGKRFTFARGHGSAACDDGRPVPQAGEPWVVYFWKRATGEYDVWQSYPLAVAVAADPRLKRLSEPKRP
jgi:hypothetical protein